MIITITGRPGSGKGTVGKMLAQRLKYKYFTIGGIRREIAKSKGMTLEEYNRLGEKKSFTDKPVDAWQKKYGRTKDNTVMEGRLSWYFIPHSVKIFLDVSLPEGARRIWHDSSQLRQHEAKFFSHKSVIASLKRRIASDTRRYRRYYGVDIFNRRHYDLVVRTTNRTPKQVLQVILKHLNEKSLLKHGVNNQGTIKAPIHK